MFFRARRIERKLDELISLVTKGNLTMSDLATLITALNDNTNAVAARMDKLQASLADVATPAQLSELQAISDHLKALGSDPANPVPPPAPAPAPAQPTP